MKKSYQKPLITALSLIESDVLLQISTEETETVGNFYEGWLTK